MNFENMLSNKHNHKRPSMILIHSYEMSKTGKSETESKLDFSDSGTTPLNCIFHWVYFMVYEIYLKKDILSTHLYIKKDIDASNLIFKKLPYILKIFSSSFITRGQDFQTYL